MSEEVLAEDEFSPSEHDVMVLALASDLYRNGGLHLALGDPIDIDCRDIASAVLASDWLAARLVDAWDEGYQHCVRADEDIVSLMDNPYRRELA